MLGPTYLDVIRYFYYACLTRPPDVLSRVSNLAGATQRIKIDKIESQVVPAEEADLGSIYTGPDPFGTCTKLVRISLVFNQDLADLLSGTKWAHL